MGIKHSSYLSSVEQWYDHLDREATLPGRRSTLHDFGLLCLLGFYARLNRRPSSEEGPRDARTSDHGEVGC